MCQLEAKLSQDNLRDENLQAKVMCTAELELVVRSAAST